MIKRDWEIVEVKNSKAIPIFAEIACKMKDWESEYTYDDMIRYFEARFGLPDFKVFLETSNILGLMAIQAITPIAEPLLSIEILWTAPNTPGLTRTFLNQAEQQAIQWGIKKIITTIKRPAIIKKYTRSKAEDKYGFHPYGLVAVKEINGGKDNGI